MRWFWALLLISIGITYFGSQVGLWSAETANQIWQLWPLLLVLFGLNLLVKRSKAVGVIMILGFVVAGLFVWGVLSNEDSMLAQKRQEKTDSARESSISIDTPSDIEKAIYEINTGAIQMDLKGQTGKLLEGVLSSTFAEPKVETSVSNKIAKVKLSTIPFSKKFMFNDIRNFLDLKLTDSVPADIKIDSGASDLNLDFSNVRLKDLDLNSGASSIDVKVGNSAEKDARLSFEAGASDINIQYQKGLGVRIESESGLAQEEFE